VTYDSTSHTDAFISVVHETAVQPKRMLDWAVKVSKAQSAESECLSYQDHLATGSD